MTVELRAEAFSEICTAIANMNEMNDRFMQVGLVIQGIPEKDAVGFTGSLMAAADAAVFILGYNKHSAYDQKIMKEAYDKVIELRTEELAIKMNDIWVEYAKI